MLTAADDRRVVTVPAGTIVEVRLEPEHGTAWTVPQSSDRVALPRLSASDRCDPVAVATFRAVGPGEIMASRPYGDAVRQFRVTVRIAPQASRKDRGVTGPGTG